MTGSRLQAARNFLAAGNLESARREAAAVLADQPNDPGAHAVLAMCAVEQGQPDDARPHLDTALAVAPTDPEVLLVAFHHALAVDAVPHAEAIADTLAQALPDTGLYEECAARILMMKGDFRGALSHLERAMALRPRIPGLLVLAALTHEALHEPDRAWDWAMEALRLAPERADAHLLIARVTLASGDVAQAERHTQEALRLAPDDEGAVALLLGLRARQSWVLGLWWRSAREMDRRPMTWFFALLVVLLGARTGIALAGLPHLNEVVSYIVLGFAAYVAGAGAWFRHALHRARRGVALEDY